MFIFVTCPADVAVLIRFTFVYITNSINATNTIIMMFTFTRVSRGFVNFILSGYRTSKFDDDDIYTSRNLSIFHETH